MRRASSRTRTPANPPEPRFTSCGACGVSAIAARTGAGRATPTAMKPIVPVLLLAALASFGHAASSGDPLDTGACRAARAELDEALAAAGARPDARLERARRTARNVCLGRASANPQRSGAPDPPAVVPPPPPPPALAAPRPAPQPPPLPATVPPPVPLPVPRPTTITTCDPGGCWDSQGRRLNQAGPLLLGPNGLCTVQGGQVTCP